MSARARRLLTSYRWNIVVQARNGFYLVSAIFVLVRVAVLRQLPSDTDLALVVPGLLANNLIITTFYFFVALVLLEKSEGSVIGLATTPLRVGEYFQGKVGSLALLAMVESLLLIILTEGVRFNLLLLVAGMVALSGLYALVGFVVVARFDSLNEYLLPSILVVMALWLPLLDHFGLVRSPLFWLHPMQPALVLLRAAFAPAAAPGQFAWQLAYGVLGSFFWLVLSYAAARRSFARFIVRAPGV